MAPAAAALPAETPDGRARAAALQEAAPTVGGTERMGYRSRGRVLVIGEAEVVRRVLAGLGEDLTGVGVVPAGPEAEGEGDPRLVRGRMSGLSGHLGNFSAWVETGEGMTNPAARLGPEEETFDLVVDLEEPPNVAEETPPLGYYHPGADPGSLGRVLAELPEMVGEFEKPRFFAYQAEICAHGQRGQSGCSRCLDACPTGAITSAGETVAVDPYLCQGCGICATTCPTGAMTYAYPPVGDLLATVRRTLAAYGEHGGGQACVLFHDSEAGAETVARAGGSLPERVLPFQVEELPSVGMEAWLAALAYGASEVVLLRGGGEETGPVRELQAQVEQARAVLEGLGFDPARIRLVEGHQLPGTLEGAPPPAVPAAGFAALGAKREILRLALDHLHGQAPEAVDWAPLPEGAAFGEVRVDGDACTLCMACVSTCPAGALLDGEDRPQVRFLEGNCVQCGLCESACPEDAVTLFPRMAYVPSLHKQARILHEEEPFHCIGCGKPFATRSMVDRMSEKLVSHWMYRDSDAMVRRLQMCGDCRVKDLFAQEGGLDVHGKG